MSWSEKQRRMILTATRLAGWNILNRYVVMKHCGCPLDPETKMPSIKHERNTHEQFAMYMSFAEPVARDRGRPLYPPKDHESWEAVVNDRAQRLRHRARRIIDEAIQKMPHKYDAGLEEYVIGHVYKCDQSKGGAQFLEHEPETLEQCDAPTVHRVIECLRQFVGREFAIRGITPSSFDIPRGAQERARAS
jgi:hypothetical protein